MNYQINTHCPDCFQPSQSAVCSHCAFNRDDYLHSKAALHYLKPFTVLGNYIIGRVLGCGSFAIVYTAIRPHDRLACAVKEYFPQQFASRHINGNTVNPQQADLFVTWKNRFEEEAKFLRDCGMRPAIDGVVNYVDCVQQHGTAYLVMERLYGQPLGEFLQPRQPMSTAKIALWLEPLLATLQQLHEKGIFHRDISPNNIFLCGKADLPGFKNLEGLKVVPVLMDFGLAREGVRETWHSTTLGAGTFIAPEQLNGGRCDQRTDLYSLGAMIYLCLYGQAPPPVDLRRQGAPLNRLQQADNLTAQLEKLAWHCLELDIDKRPENVAAIRRKYPLLWRSQNTIIPDRPYEKKQTKVEPPTPSKFSFKSGLAVGVIALVGWVVYANQTKPKPAPVEIPAAPAVAAVPVPAADVPAVEVADAVAPPARLSFEPEMVFITGGTFQMGSPASETGRSSDETQHKVQLGDFEMGKYEVTKEQFAAFVSDSNYQTEAETGDGCYGWIGSTWEKDKKYNWKNLGFEQTDQHPVACVSWNDAQAYLKWLNEKTGKDYHLPTEAQWEYAARAGTTTAYPWGDVASHEYANYGTDACCNGLISGKDQWFFTAPVGSFAAYQGLHDMHGNVWEWTGSDYAENYDGKENFLSNNDAKTLRAIRGGSWSNNPYGLRSANRSNNTPYYRNYYLGLRLSRM